MLILISQSPMWRLQIASFVQTAAQNTKNPHWLSEVTQRSGKSYNLQTEPADQLTILFDKKWLKRLISYQNSCQLIFP